MQRLLAQCTTEKTGRISGMLHTLWRAELRFVFSLFDYLLTRQENLVT